MNNQNTNLHLLNDDHIPWREKGIDDALPGHSLRGGAKPLAAKIKLEEADDGKRR